MSLLLAKVKRICHQLVDSLLNFGREQVEEQVEEARDMYDSYGYRKDSMDRLGDDLTEEVLQYLPFNKKARPQCVSKQWQRCVFQKQFVIKISDERIFKSLVKKIPSIKKVILLESVSGEMLELIGQYCQRIKSLDFCYYSNDSKTLDFFRIYGHKLEELILRQFLSGSATKEILDLCPNIKKLGVGNI